MTRSHLINRPAAQGKSVSPALGRVSSVVVFRFRGYEMACSLSGRLMSMILCLLEPGEREAVQGDLTEAGEGGWHALFGVVGLLARRQLDLWKNWRPWLAAFGLAVPGSFLLMGFSLSVSHAYQQWIGPELRPGLALLVCNVVLLVGLAWTCAFVVGSLSRRTLWVSATLSFAPCLFCLERFRIESLSRFCLLLFLPPAIWGVVRSLKIARIKLGSALVLAGVLTLLTIPSWGRPGAWLPNWALSWPAWYLVATAKKPSWLAGRTRRWRIN